MFRFILLTFGFLGFAFYEMSGGAQFEPASDRVARLNGADAGTQVAEAPAPGMMAATAGTLPASELETAQIVTRADTALNTLEAVPAVQKTDGFGVPQNVQVTLASAESPAIIPSLIVPNDSGAPLTEASVPDEPRGEMRTVSGSRVNVRSGPGTNYGVVAKVERGDAVEIFEDNGSGWVRMRSVDGGPVGWMADFLLES